MDMDMHAEPSHSSSRRVLTLCALCVLPSACAHRFACRSLLAASRLSQLVSDSLKSTLKLLYGLSLGLRVVRPKWVDDCLKEQKWLTPTDAHIVITSSAPSVPRRPCRASSVPAVSAATPVAAGKLFAGYVVVALGSEDWRVTWSALLRTAGAEVRSDLPPLHHCHEDGKPCVVVVQKDAQKVVVAGPMQRASKRGLLVASQDWVKHCLLQGEVLDATDFLVVTTTPG